MKTPQEWWSKFQQPKTQVAIVCIPDIEAIQADARADLQADLHEAAELLRYVAYQRLPLGDTVFDHLDFERQKHIDSFLAKLKDGH